MMAFGTASRRHVPRSFHRSALTFLVPLALALFLLPTATTAAVQRTPVTAAGCTALNRKATHVLCMQMEGTLQTTGGKATTAKLTYTMTTIETRNGVVVSEEQREGTLHSTTVDGITHRFNHSSRGTLTVGGQTCSVRLHEVSAGGEGRVDTLTIDCD
jgi:hypothetical protein